MKKITVKQLERELTQLQMDLRVQGPDQQLLAELTRTKMMLKRTQVLLKTAQTARGREGEREVMRQFQIILVRYFTLRGRDSELRLEKPPGQLLLNVIGKIVSNKKLEHTFEPLIADWQEEYFEALQDNEGRVKLFFISFRHRLAFAKACGWSAIVKFALDAYKFISGK